MAKIARSMKQSRACVSIRHVELYSDYEPSAYTRSATRMHSYNIHCTNLGRVHAAHFRPDRDRYRSGCSVARLPVFILSRSCVVASIDLCSSVQRGY